jgi:hypothetical protein
MMEGCWERERMEEEEKLKKLRMRQRTNKIRK